jgi:hypothetical protein
MRYNPVTGPSGTFRGRTGPKVEEEIVKFHLRLPGRAFLSIAVQLFRELRSALSVERGENGSISRTGNVPRGQLQERNQFLRASPLSRSTDNP